MKVAVVSDTHGNYFAIRKAARAALASGAEALIHLGDLAGDVRQLTRLTKLQVYNVRGNCDAPGAAESEKVVELGGARLFITHGHRYDVGSSLLPISCRAEELKCDAALFGHTHTSLIDASGRLLIINPGSAAEPRNGTKNSVAVLDINDGRISPSIVII